MRSRPPGNTPPYTTKHSDLFEAGYFRLKNQFLNIGEAFDNLDWSLRRAPHADSEPCPAFADRDLRLVLTTRTTRYPSLRILIEIDEANRRVICWHLAVRLP